MAAPRTAASQRAGEDEPPDGQARSAQTRGRRAATARAPVEDGPVHRPLIRATLPRIEGHKEVRQATDFTIRQSNGRGANSRAITAAAIHSARGRARRTGQGQGARPTGRRQAAPVRRRARPAIRAAGQPDGRRVAASAPGSRSARQQRQWRTSGGGGRKRSR